MKVDKKKIKSYKLKMKNKVLEIAIPPIVYLIVP
jgi:uncharacterized membrane protein